MQKNHKLYLNSIVFDIPNPEKDGCECEHIVHSLTLQCNIRFDNSQKEQINSFLDDLLAKDICVDGVQTLSLIKNKNSARRKCKWKIKKITTDDIAEALINLSENTGFCDKETAIGFRTSKKKDILKSGKENMFRKFINEIRKRQTKKDWEDVNDDN